MTSSSIFEKKWDDASEGDTPYTRPSVSALGSSALGLSTFLVYFSPWFFFLGVIAILLSLFAFWTIRNGEGILTGTTFAYVGLCSAVAALVSIAVFWSAYHYGLRQEADQFFRLWFAAVLEGDIPKAKEYQALYPNRSQAATADEWWEAQYGERYAHRSVHMYVENKLIRVLMALGSEAKVSYYKTLSVISSREYDTVASVYAVTFPAESGGMETFFVRIAGKRSFPAASSDFTAAGWHIENSPAFYLPDEYKTNAEER